MVICVLNKAEYMAEKIISYFLSKNASKRHAISKNNKKTLKELQRDDYKYTERFWLIASRALLTQISYISYVYISKQIQNIAYFLSKMH